MLFINVGMIECLSSSCLSCPAKNCFIYWKRGSFHCFVLPKCVQEHPIWSSAGVLFIKHDGVVGRKTCTIWDLIWDMCMKTCTSVSWTISTPKTIFKWKHWFCTNIEILFLLLLLCFALLEFWAHLQCWGYLWICPRWSHLAICWWWYLNTGI